MKLLNAIRTFPLPTKRDVTRALQLWSLDLFELFCILIALGAIASIAQGMMHYHS